MPARAREKLGKAPMKEIGISYSNFDRSGRGDAEFVPTLRGRRGVDTYRQMAENDATISSVLFAVEMSIRNVTWRIDPNKEHETNDKDLEFIRTALFEDMDHSFSDYIAEALSFLTFGWCVHEKVYKLRNGPNLNNPMHNSVFNDGRIGLRKISLRSQSSLHRWIFEDKNGEIRGIEQFTQPKGIVSIPIEKCIYFRTTGLEGAPEGRSMLRGAYRSWYYLRHLEQIESIAIERELNGLPVVYVPSELLKLAADGDEAAATTVEKYEEAVRDVKLNTQGSLVLPSDVFTDQDGKLTGNRKVMFELVASRGSRNIDTNQVISRYQANIMRTVLADFILLGSTKGTTGSYALGTDRSQLFSDALGGWVDIMTESLQRMLIQPLWEINGLPIEQIPQIAHGAISRESIESLGMYVKDLAAAGMPLFPDEELEAHLRKKAELPAASDELTAIRDAQMEPEAGQKELLEMKIQSDEKKEKMKPAQQSAKKPASKK